MILMSSSSTSSVGIPSERSIFRNSFIPPPKRLHSKSVSFSLVFFLNIKFDLLVFGNTILQGGLCFVECVDYFNINYIERNFSIIVSFSLLPFVANLNKGIPYSSNILSFFWSLMFCSVPSL